MLFHRNPNVNTQWVQKRTVQMYKKIGPTTLTDPTKLKRENELEPK